MLHGFAWKKKLVHLLGVSLHDWTASSWFTSDLGLHFGIKSPDSVGHFLLLGQLPQDEYIQIYSWATSQVVATPLWKSCMEKINHPKKKRIPTMAVVEGSSPIFFQLWNGHICITKRKTGWKNQGEHEGTHQPCLCKESSTPSLYKQPQPPKNSAMRQEASWDCESHKWWQSIFHLFERHHLSWSHLCGCTKTVWCLKKNV